MSSNIFTLSAPTTAPNLATPEQDLNLSHTQPARRLSALRFVMFALLQLALAALLFGAMGAHAADRYVRAGATGAQNGTDWANAYASLPATLVRGDTYYIASGSYPAYTFDDAQSGTLTITIKKATATNHGTSTGWQAAYGTGQAVFNSTLRFDRGYYVIDGQTRNEDDWFAGDQYGFRIAHANKDQNIVISGGSSSSNITFKYVFVDAIYANLPQATVRRYAIDTDTYGGSIATGLVFHRMYVYGSNNVWFLRTTNGAIVEYSASNGATGSSSNHGEIVNLYYSGNNAIIRYNKFKNAYVNGGGTALVAITYADGLQFYGNVATDFQVGDGAVGFLGGDASNCVVYNNTFVRGTGAAGFASKGSNNRVYNNIWVGNRSVSIDGTHDYNSFSGSSALGEPNGQANVSTSIFANYTAGDMRLTGPTAAGLKIAAPYNTDMLGKTGSDGTWDRGAFQYGGSVVIAPPSNLQVK